MPALAAWPYPRMAAHRGAGKLAPENTLAAMRAGLAHGYRMVELDAKLSADGVAFLLHDDTLDRTTSGRGRADALTFGELARLDAGGWHSAAYAGEPVPALAAIARWSIANAVAVNVEIKPMPGRERDTGAALALDARALWKDAAVPPLLSSFSEVALQAAAEVAPELARAWLCEASRPPEWIARCRALGCAAIDVRHDRLDRAAVAEVHAAGLRLATWTPNDPGRVAEVLDWGVDTVITDAVDRIPAA